MDATTQLSTDTPFYWQFYNPLTGAPYAPTPAPTGVVYRLNVDGTRTALVGVPTPVALTAIAGLTGAYTYVLDDSLNTALGTLIGQATTTDAVLTPYPEYATRNYVVEVQKFTFSADKVNSTDSALLAKLTKFVQLILRKDTAIATDNATELTEINANGGSGPGAFDNITDSQQAIADNAGGSAPTAAQVADAVWDELMADHATLGSAGAFMAFIRAQVALISTGILRIVSPFSSITYDITLQRANDYNTGDAGGAFTIPSMIPGIDLTLAVSIELEVSKPSGGRLFLIKSTDSGAPIQVTSSSDVLVRDITAAQLTVKAGQYTYRAIAIFSDGRKTFAKGNFVVQ